MINFENTKLERDKQQIKSLMLGPLWDHFCDPKTVELMVNADGTLWVEKLGQSSQAVAKIDEAAVRSIILNVSGFHNQVVSASNAVCEGEFPIDGSRFEGLLPPISSAPCFSLRKKATAIFTLSQYVDSRIMTEVQHNIITQAVVEHKNILVIGGTGSGKTTLINAIIQEMVDKCPQDRVIIIEDTGEIQCAAKNHLQLRANMHTSMTDLLRATLRLRPDRILVGEVRGPEALDLLDAWSTGHPGGCATLHANSALAGLDRLKSLVTRNKAAPDTIEPLIGDTVDLVINIARDHGGRRIKEILKVNGWKGSEYSCESAVSHPLG